MTMEKLTEKQLGILSNIATKVALNNNISHETLRVSNNKKVLPVIAMYDTKKNMTGLLWVNSDKKFILLTDKKLMTDMWMTFKSSPQGRNTEFITITP